MSDDYFYKTILPLTYPTEVNYVDNSGDYDFDYKYMHDLLEDGVYVVKNYLSINGEDTIHYIKNHNIHREYGAAIICDKYKYYYLNDIEYSEEDYCKKMYIIKNGLQCYE